MKTTRFLFLLLSLFAVASASSNSQSGGRDLERHEDVDEDETVNMDLSELTDRDLLTTAQCPSPGATVFFNVKTIIVPGWGAQACGDTKLEAIGNMINTALVNAGVATYSGSIFLAGMCDTPTISTASSISSLLNGFVRRLQSGFIWTGGGVSWTDLSCLYLFS
jgi:hypothetical protein